MPREFTYTHKTSRVIFRILKRVFSNPEIVRASDEVRAREGWGPPSGARSPLTCRPPPPPTRTPSRTPSARKAAPRGPSRPARGTRNRPGRTRRRRKRRTRAARVCGAERAERVARVPCDPRGGSEPRAGWRGLARAGRAAADAEGEADRRPPLVVVSFMVTMRPRWRSPRSRLWSRPGTMPVGRRAPTASAYIQQKRRESGRVGGQRGSRAQIRKGPDRRSRRPGDGAETQNGSRAARLRGGAAEVVAKSRG